ncbi:MAG: 4-(cytidine 5'-diphospho)-2-C-methyl-D-erythritol kinase [Ktedonobacterales bacterium]|nr:4-(cytidine 5'-diphospho)-2-C-methyl-D-erythritol kinase [Ktedonobacterales bacterium]
MPRYSSIFVPAYAKINLTLSVLGRRDDGYHALASVMQTISLHDTLRITPNASGACVCETDVPALQSPDNLALRAAWLLAATAADGTPGVAIELRKEIPAQGGLGGGSGDAATVLVALNALWRTHHPQAELERLGATLGSDVPFFVRGGTCLIEGRGERVTPLPDVE